jgi:hypothetical protein
LTNGSRSSVSLSPDIDIAAVPWSVRGSYLTLSTLAREVDHPGRDAAVEPGLYLFDISGSRFFGDWNGIFRLSGLASDGTTATPRVRSCTPSHLVLQAREGTIEVTWDGPDSLRFRGRGTGLRLVQTVTDPLESAIAFPHGDRTWHLMMGEHPHYVVTGLVGNLTVDAPRIRTNPTAEPDRKIVDVLPDADDAFELALTQYETGYRAPAEWRTFDDCQEAVDGAFAAWLARQPAVAERYADAAALSAYLTWSCVVGPRGLLARPAMLMSKNWMFATWSWDHCFNAQGLARVDAQLAWDQLMLLFDHQHPQGALPDLVHDYGRMYGFVKPPVHGWTLRRLDQAGVVSAERLAEVYPKLALWTEWWLTYRDGDDDGLCEYHHGNDGMDNASIFDGGTPVAAPDLAALLVVQMDVLADVAHRLGIDEDAQRWRRRADEMLERLLERLWDGERFVVRRIEDGSVDPASQSIVRFLPLILGQRLPHGVRRRLVDDFRASDHLTAYGPATESPSSVRYEADGYWRGPVWAPTTLLIVDGLDACGEAELARDVARRFVETCRASGFAENFEATSGRPLRDPAYSWTASTFVRLVSEFLTGDEDGEQGGEAGDR